LQYIDEENQLRYIKDDSEKPNKVEGLSIHWIDYDKLALALMVMDELEEIVRMSGSHLRMAGRALVAQPADADHKQKFDIAIVGDSDMIAIRPRIVKVI